VVVFRFVLLTLFISICFGQLPQNIVVTSAANPQVGLPPKGSIGSIRCTGLQIHGTFGQSIPAPTLAGISVTVGAAPAPIFAVADVGGSQLIYFQVPQEAVFNADTTATIVVTQNGNQGSVQVPVSTSPGEFFSIDGKVGAFQHASDFSVVTERNPAHPGELIFGYLTGLPGAYPTVPTGVPTPSSPPSRVTDVPLHAFGLLLGGTIIGCSSCTPPKILFLGLTPGLVGVYQINFVVPASVPTSDASIQLETYSCTRLFGSCPDPTFSLDTTVGCQKTSLLEGFITVCKSSQSYLPISSP
jgi:uncharacterized protein (TIGR03437 family)